MNFTFKRYAYATMLFFSFLLFSCSGEETPNVNKTGENESLASTGLSRSISGFSPLLCDGFSKGYDLPDIDPTLLSENFRIELVFSVAELQRCPYATILDINHRTNVGLVIQQDGDNNNTFIFGVGDGSQSYMTRYTFEPTEFSAVVFEKINGLVRLDIGTTSSLETCSVMKASNRKGNMAMSTNVSFLQNSYPTLGYNKNYGRYFNGTIYLAKFYQCSGSAEYSRFNSTPNYSGNPILSGDPASKMTGDFVIEMALQNELTQNDYATILDINHRDNIGLVIQQNGSNTNNYSFGIGYGESSTCFTYDLTGAHYHVLEFRRDGSLVSLAHTKDIVNRIDTGYTGSIKFLPESKATEGYNVNYDRYFNGKIDYTYIWTPVPPVQPAN